jgi:fumarate reductase subunit D
MFEIARILGDSLEWIVTPIMVILAVFAAWFLLKGTRKFMQALYDLIHDPIGWIFFILMIAFAIYLFTQFKGLLGGI